MKSAHTIWRGERHVLLLVCPNNSRYFELVVIGHGFVFFLLCFSELEANDFEFGFPVLVLEATGFVSSFQFAQWEAISVGYGSAVFCRKR